MVRVRGRPEFATKSAAPHCLQMLVVRMLPLSAVRVNVPGEPERISRPSAGTCMQVAKALAVIRWQARQWHV